MAVIDILKDEKARQTIRDVGVVILFAIFMYLNHIEKMEAIRGEATKMVAVLERQLETDERLAKATESMVETYTGKKL